jgi:hypothetical protein
MCLLIANDMSLLFTVYNHSGRCRNADAYQRQSWVLQLLSFIILATFSSMEPRSFRPLWQVRDLLSTAGWGLV